MRQLEIDGVPTLFVEAVGPVRAGLMFRVGRADESLALSGITHLVEHLALHRLGLMDHHANANVSDTVTHFYTSGTGAEVVAFFDKLCASLAEPPLDRLAVEKQILQTEAAGRGKPVNVDLPLWRYGAQGYGLVSYSEFGLHRIAADDLRRWVAAHFTRDNAVLWVAAPELPAGLRLSLPAGAWRPCPQQTSVLESTPAYFQAPVGGVVMDTVVPRSVAARLYRALLERALYRNLRLEGGVSYTATTDYSPLGDGMAVITAYIDALPEKQSAALTGFVDTVKQLAASAVDEGELESVRAAALAALDHPDAAVARLPGAAVDLLTRQPLLSSAELAGQLRAVTTVDVMSVAQEAYANALLQVPYGVSTYGTGLVAAPTTSRFAVEGQRHASRGGDSTALIIGAEGVSTVSAAGKIATVRFADCAARLRWPDGGSLFIGKDGMAVQVEPTLYQLDDATLAALDKAVPDEVTVPMPAREASGIPQPQLNGPPSRQARRLEFLILAPVTAALLVAFIALASAWTPEDGTWTENLLLLMMCVTAAGVVRVAIVGIHRLHLGRW